MDSTREAKRAAFVKADAVLRHVLLLRCRNHGLAGQLTATQAVDVNKVAPLDLLHVHGAQAALTMAAGDPVIVNLFLAILNPQDEIPSHRFPVELLREFELRTRAELGLAPLQLPADANFLVNLTCNLVTPVMGSK